jgi:hypothetical protein
MESAGQGGGDIEVPLVGGPRERCPQVGQLGDEPRVGLALSGTVPQGQDVGFAAGKVMGVFGAGCVGFTGARELFLGGLSDGLQH